VEPRPGADGDRAVDVVDDADSAVWGMFAVTLPVPEAGLALVRRVVKALG